jgi:hypothetical protein
MDTPDGTRHTACLAQGKGAMQRTVGLDDIERVKQLAETGATLLVELMERTKGPNDAIGVLSMVLAKLLAITQPDKEKRLLVIRETASFLEDYSALLARSERRH